MMKYVLSLDGGGTKLLCLIADQNGKLVGEGKSGPTNRNFNSPEEIKFSINNAIDQAISQNGIDKNDISIVYAAMPVNADFAIEIISECVHANLEINMCGEFLPSLYGAIQNIYGGLALSGTGSFATLRVKNEQDTGLWNPMIGEEGKGGFYSVGGWGAIIGDEGSGFYIGRRALITFAEMTDGRKAPSILLEKIYDFFGTRDQEEIIHAVYPMNPGKQRTLIASLCPVVADSVRAGDAYAKKILEDAGKQLAIQMMAAIKKAKIDFEFPVSVSGGVWKAHPTLFKVFSSTISKELPIINVQKPLFEPVVGGVLLGLRHFNFDAKENLDQLKIEFEPYSLSKWF